MKVILRSALRHPILILVVLIVAGLAAATITKFWQNLQQRERMGFGNNSTLVLVQKPRMETIVDQLEAIGTASANESVNLSAKVTDTVRAVNFEDGDSVKGGKILLELTNVEETAMLTEAQATLNEAAAQLNRIDNLIRQGLASQTQLDEVKVRQQTAAARLDVILARLDDRLIRAPFSGVLGFRKVSPGTLVTPGTLVATLDDLSIVKVDFSVPEIYLSVLHNGLDVVAMSSAYPDRRFKGTVRTIGSRVDPVTRAVSIRAHITNEENLLRPGMLLTISLIRDRESVMVIAEEALIPILDKQFVFVVDDSGRAQRVEVVIGRRRPGIVEVVSGLGLTARVVTEGAMALRPGGLVTIKGEPAKPGAPFSGPGRARDSKG